VFVCFKQETNVETSVPTSGTQSTDGGVQPNESGVQFGTGGTSCAIKNVVWITLKII
jgi:hypothetical protein